MGNNEDRLVVEEVSKCLPGFFCRYDFIEGGCLLDGLHWGKILTLSDNVPDESYIGLIFVFGKPSVQYDPRWGRERMLRRTFIAMCAWKIKFRWRIGVHWDD